jgi:tetratricopeptide (TPR) repeat protein
MSDSSFHLADTPFDLETLIDAAVNEVLRHEDAQLFFAWMRENIGNFLSPVSDNYPDTEGTAPFSQPSAIDQIELDSALIRSMAMNFAYMIWNSIPLPSNRFIPLPMAMPKRNEFCYCGSGKKYKLCCAQMPPMPSITPEEMWPILFAKLDKSVAARALHDNQIPLSALYIIASDYFDANHPIKVVTLLQPLFVGEIRKTNADADYALNLLCNAFDHLGHHKKKTTLLKSIVAGVERSPLRSGAWQRLAAISIDNGNADSAWSAFQNAQRDDPDSPNLGLLEVQILNAQGLDDKAAERANFWMRRLRNQGYADDEMPLAFLIDVSEDPVAAFAELGLEFSDDMGLLLKQWIEGVQDRPLPYNYRFSDKVAPSDNDYSASVAKIIQTPDTLQPLEKQWHEVFPLSKPFSTDELPNQYENPWDLYEELEWSDWLMNNPSAFDSIDILDDLVTALILHPQFGAPWLSDTVLWPLLQRSNAIFEKLVDTDSKAQIPWVVADNRPALRGLSRLVTLNLDRNEPDLALQQAAHLIGLNPSDNHGFRMMVMNIFIVDDLDEEALKLAESYPGDINPEIAFGAVLALYRLGKPLQAIEALTLALEHLGKIPHYLITSRVKKPKMFDDRVTYGGDDQAWIYREEMRPVWQQTPGALDWLRKTVKSLS